MKLVYYSRAPHELGGRLNFLKFETDKIDACIGFMRQLQTDFERHKESGAADFRVMATGGGAFKYYDRIREELKINVLREDEMDCLITGKLELHCRVLFSRIKLYLTCRKGLDFFISEIPTEVFTYSESDPMHFLEPSTSIYPYLLVNIGSGVSLVKVSGPKRFERIGGTSLGGGTLWGLLSLLTGARTFDEMLQLAEKGDNRNVDMLVGDIYGMDYGKVGLKSSTIASSFGKVFKMKREAERDAEDHATLANGDDRHQRDRKGDEGDGVDDDSNTFRPEDISRSLLFAIRLVRAATRNQKKESQSFTLSIMFNLSFPTYPFLLSIHLSKSTTIPIRLIFVIIFLSYLSHSYFSHVSYYFLFLLSLLSNHHQNHHLLYVI